MAISKGLRLVAMGIALTDDERKRKVKQINAMIDSLADSLASPNLDGMPHGSGISDSTGRNAERIEQLTEARDAEQHYINAVEWAKKEVTSIYNPDEGNKLLQAIDASLRRNNDKAEYIIEAETNITLGGFRYCKNEYLKQILLYLRLM